MYFSSSRAGRSKIYASRRLGENRWAEPMKIIGVPPNQPQLWGVGEPTLTADGRWLYFVIVFNKNGGWDCDIARTQTLS